MKWLPPLLALANTALAACNGHDALCSRRYSNITYMGTHNSAFDGIGPFHNQFVSVTKQLDLGVRFLQARTQDKDGHPQMCHSHCWALDEGPLEDYLTKVGDWLDENEDEVVTLLVTNVDGLPIEKFDEAFRKTGVRDYAFRPEKRLGKEEWPTLQEIIDLGTRLIVFMGTLKTCSTLLALCLVLTRNRLQHGREESPLHHRRVQALLGNPLRRDRQQLPHLRSRPA